MRIIGGRLKGSILVSLEGNHLRPTADRVKESVFNILLHGTNEFTIENITVIDVFCGTGALGLEAISRGAKHSVFIDSNKDALEITRQNASSMGLEREVTVLKLDAQDLAHPPNTITSPATLAFLDPPYNQGLVGTALLGLRGKGWLEQGAVCVIEVSAKEELNIPEDFYVLNERIYGLTRIVFLRYNIL